MEYPQSLSIAAIGLGLEKSHLNGTEDENTSYYSELENKFQFQKLMQILK